MVVLRGTRSVALEFPAPGDAPGPPRCDGLLLSLVRASGACEVGFIEVRAGDFPGSPGEIWRTEWRKSGKGWTLAAEAPDMLFSDSFDPVVRLSVEAVDTRDPDRVFSLGAVAVTVVAPACSGGRELPAWLPAEWVPSTEQLGL